MLENQHEQVSGPDRRPKWFNSPVTFHEGKLPEIRRHIPAFERRSFGLTQHGNERSRLNKHLDTIVRLPCGEDQTFIPVGVVSKDYVLVPHESVLNIAIAALDDVKVKPGDVKAELKITEYGERMALSVYLPEKYRFDPGDGHSMALRLELLNSVDGSTRFRALMGWFRFVCSNGLTVGVTRSDLRRRHIGDVGLTDVQLVLKSGLEEAKTEQRNFDSWRKAKISPDRLAPWVNGELWKRWGFKAAARTFHTARFGSDGEIIGQYKGRTPTTIPMRATKSVPGASRPCGNLFDLSQILAWLAKERRDVQEQLQWREEIPELMAFLMN